METLSGARKLTFNQLFTWDSYLSRFSGYEVYDRLSPSFAKYLETLTAAHEAHFFRDAAIAYGYTVRDQVRGSPGNFGDALEAVHPVIR